MFQAIHERRLADFLEGWLLDSGVIPAGLQIDEMSPEGDSYLCSFSYEDANDKLHRDVVELKAIFFTSGGIEDVQIDGQYIRSASAREMEE